VDLVTGFDWSAVRSLDRLIAWDGRALSLGA
jgi:hypothetical protein